VSSTNEGYTRVDLAWTTSRPVLALATDRARVARNNPVFGGPEDWFRAESLREANAEGVTFDFFVNWRTRGVDDRLWIKRVAIRSPGSGIVTAGLDDVRRALEPWSDEIRAAHRFAVDYGFDDRWVVIPEWWDWTTSFGKVLFAQVSDGLVSAVRAVDFGLLCEEIHVRTGEYFRPSKGLTFSTSKLEAALSRTATPWPGDADLVVFDADSQKALGVIEYKKHTLATPIRPTFADYYPGVDSRRWDRLALLAQRLQAPLYCLYFSVKGEESTTLLQRISGPARSLRAEKALEFPAPLASDLDAQKEYVCAVVDVLRAGSA